MFTSRRKIIKLFFHHSMQFHSKRVKMELSDSTVGEKYKRMGLDLQMNVNRSRLMTAHIRNEAVSIAQAKSLC